MLRDQPAYIGVKRVGNTKTVVMISGLSMVDADWTTTTKGSEVTSATFSGIEIRLRASGDTQSIGNKFGVFNFATKALGGSIVVKSFEMQKI
ncbi:xylosidase glycosyl [Moniliophthora roreri]|nr:xylosidase glycosyl [Moniliophthora roreri]